MALHCPAIGVGGQWPTWPSAYGGVLTLRPAGARGRRATCQGRTTLSGSSARHSGATALHTVRLPFVRRPQAIVASASAKRDPSNSAPGTPPVSGRGAGKGGSNALGASYPHAASADMYLNVINANDGLALSSAATIKATFPAQYQQGGGDGFLYTPTGTGGNMLQAHPVKVYVHAASGKTTLTGVGRMVRGLGLQRGDRLLVSIQRDGRAVVQPAPPVEPKDPSRVPVPVRTWHGKQGVDVSIATVIYLLGEEAARGGTRTVPVHEEAPPGQPLGPQVGLLQGYFYEGRGIRWRIGGSRLWRQSKQPTAGSYLQMAAVRGQGAAVGSSTGSGQQAPVTAVTVRFVPGSGGVP